MFKVNPDMMLRRHWQVLSSVLCE